MDFWWQAGKSKLERIPNVTICEIIDASHKISEEIKRKQLRWYGDVQWMGEEQLPKQVLLWKQSRQKYTDWGVGWRWLSGTTHIASHGPVDGQGESRLGLSKEHYKLDVMVMNWFQCIYSWFRSHSRQWKIQINSLCIRFFDHMLCNLNFYFFFNSQSYSIKCITFYDC